MAAADAADAAAKTQNIRDAATGDSTRAQYDRAVLKLLIYVCSRPADNEILSARFRELAIAKFGQLSGVTKAWLKTEILASPLCLDRFPLDKEKFTVQWYEIYLTGLRTKDGKAPTPESLGSDRSALKDLFRRFEVPWPVGWEDHLRVYFKGAKKIAARAKGKGKGRVQSGKTPMTFDLLCFLGKQCLKQGTSRFIFAHIFMLLCWNLMCRAGNTETIYFSHMEWTSDALAIYFAHMKNDQQGERPKDPRHVYANPLRPEICPILALGIYFMCTPFGEKGERIFEGDHQYDRFSEALDDLLKLPEVAAVLKQMGINPKDIGTHSFRKGGATYCTSGSTQCPSVTAVYLRAGWTIEGVQNRYLRYEAAGDYFVGRTICGLPIDAVQFALMAPAFPLGMEAVLRAIKLCFPNAPPHMYGILEYCLASVVFHQKYLRETLPASHPLWSSPLWNRDILTPLAAAVQSPQFEDKRRNVSGTGIPPTVHIMGMVAKATNAVSSLEASLPTLVHQITTEVDRLLETREIAAGSITTQILESTVERLLGPVLSEIRKRDGASATPCPPMTSPIPTPVGTYQLYNWGGKLRKVPEDFVLHKGTALAAWNEWWNGDAGYRFPPLRNLTPVDLSEPGNAQREGMRRRFSELRNVMLAMEAVRGTYSSSG